METFIGSSFIHECIVLYEEIHTLSPWEIIKLSYWLFKKWQFGNGLFPRGLDRDEQIHKNRVELLWVSFPIAEDSN